MRRFALLLALVIAAAGRHTRPGNNGHYKWSRNVTRKDSPCPVSPSRSLARREAKPPQPTAKGASVLPFLTPGKYDVKAELSGFKTIEQKGLTLALGQALDVPLKLEVGGVTETVQVVGATDIVNVNTTTTGANITSDLLERVPVGRDLGSTLYLAPGVSSSSTAGHANPSIAGGSGLDNQYVIDGVNVTNTGYGALGSYSIVFGSLGNATPYDFMQEVQVKTGGYEAEYGQATGGVVNVITKSGSNNLRGSGFGYWRPDQLESAWTQFQSTNGSVQTIGTRQYDAGVEAGAPIVRDRLFFFGAIDPGQDVRTLHAPDGFPLDSLGDVDRVTKHVDLLVESHLAGWQPPPDRRVVVRRSVERRRTARSGRRRCSSTTRPRSARSTTAATIRPCATTASSATRWLLEGTFARALNRCRRLRRSTNGASPIRP